MTSQNKEAKTKVARSHEAKAVHHEEKVAPKGSHKGEPAQPSEKPKVELPGG